MNKYDIIILCLDRVFQVIAILVTVLHGFFAVPLCMVLLLCLPVVASTSYLVLRILKLTQVAN